MVNDYCPKGAQKVLRPSTAEVTRSNASRRGKGWLLVWEATKGQRGRLALSALAGAGALASSVALMATSAWMIATASFHVSAAYLAVPAVGVRAFGIGRGVLRYVERLISHDAVFRVLARTRGGVIDALCQRIGLVTRWRRSGLHSRVIDDVDATQDLILRGVLPLLSAILVAVGASLLLAMALPLSAAITLVCILIACLALPAATSGWARRLEVEAAAVRARRNEVVGETLEQLSELTLLGAFDRALARLDVVEADDRRVRAGSARVAGLLHAMATLSTGLAMVGAIVVGTQAVREGRMSGVLLAVLTLTPLALTEAVTAAATAVEGMARSLVAADRVAELRAGTTDLVEAAPETDAVDISSIEPATLEVSGLTARWPDSETDAIRDISFTVGPGQRVAILGPSGAGKSTLAAVLLGLLPATGGTVTYNGRDLLGCYELRQQVLSWADQRAHVFTSTVAENVRLARPSATDDEVEAALEAAGLGEWLAATGAGLTTHVGEQGAALSGGQRQRLALARALLADKPLLVADEISAHLDPVTADAVTATVLERAHAVLLITHRPEDAHRCDEVLILADGRLVANQT